MLKLVSKLEVNKVMVNKPTVNNQVTVPLNKASVVNKLMVLNKDTELLKVASVVNKVVTEGEYSRLGILGCFWFCVLRRGAAIDSMNS